MTNYVKEYMGVKVPEGATRVTVDGKCTFVMNSHGLEWYWTTYNTSGKWQGNRDEEFTMDTVELPQEPESKEWVGGLPPVGCECEVSNFSNPYEVCKVLFMGKEMCIVNHPHFRSLEQHYHLSSVKFRPLKTKKEKERDAFNLAVSGAVLDAELSGSDKVGRIANALFDAGFKAPEGE